MGADQVRRVDSTMPERYQRLVAKEGKRHVSALGSVAAILMIGMAASWRKGSCYELRA